MSSSARAPGSRRMRAVAPRSKFSRTLMGANTCRPSGTSEQPARTMDSVRAALMSRFSKRISPPRARSSPTTVRSRVVLPAPLAPMMLTISPRLTCSETWRSTFRPPYPDSTLRNCRTCAGDVAVAATSGTNSCSSRIFVSQVGAHDLGILLDRQRLALRDLLPLAQHHDLVRDPHDQSHVVLDQQHGHAGIPDATNQFP